MGMILKIETVPGAIITSTRVSESARMSKSARSVRLGDKGTLTLSTKIQSDTYNRFGVGDTVAEQHLS